MFPSLNRGLIGLWVPSFGTTGLSLFDSSPNKNNGTISGATAANAWAASNGQWAYKSNATSDSIDCGAISSLVTGLSNASMSVWYYKPATTSTCSVGFLDTTNKRFGIAATAGVTYFIAETGAAQALKQLSDVRTGWIHYAMVFTPSTLTIFVNGVQTTPSSSTGTIPANLSGVAGNFRIGKSQATYNSSGALTDDVRVYNRSLSVSEIQQLYVLGRGGANALEDEKIGIGPLSRGRLLSLRRRVVAA